MESVECGVVIMVLIPVLVLMVRLEKCLSTHFRATCISLAQAIEKGSSTIHIVEREPEIAYRNPDEKSVGKIMTGVRQFL